MSDITKDLVIKALSQTSNFVEHEGNLYKMFDEVEVRQLTSYRDKKIGLFKTEPEVYIDGIEVLMKYHGEVVHQKAFRNVSIDNGDRLFLRGIGGVTQITFDET